MPRLITDTADDMNTAWVESSLSWDLIALTFSLVYPNIHGFLLKGFTAVVHMHSDNLFIIRLMDQLH